MIHPLRASHWRAVAALVAGPACVAAPLAATGAPAAAVPLEASPGERVPRGVAGALADAGLGEPQGTFPLSSARPVPPSWPHPEAMEVPVGQRHSMQSTNWSGYLASGANAKFTQASGTWTVPEVRPGPTGYSSSWVGIDGTSTQDLIQAGTEQDWGPQGVVYYAWYEVLPASSMYLGPVYPGDRVSVALAKAGPASWTIDVYDLTQGTLWAGAVSYTVPGNSAEWVEEAPTNGQTSNLYPLADFGAVEFSGLGVGGPGTGAATVSPIFMVTDTTDLVEAYPARYSPLDDSFSVQFGKPSSNPSGLEGWPAVPLGRPPGGTGHGENPGEPGAGGSTGTTGRSGGAGSGNPGGSTTGGAGSGASTTGGAGSGASTTGGAGSGASTTGGAGPSSSSPSAASLAGRRPGYWLVAGDGGVFAFGAAPYGGSVAAVFAGTKTAGVTGVARAIRGYWLVTASGGVFPLGGAPYLGSVASLNLSAGSSPTISPSPAGTGYYIVAPWGDVFAFGAARFEGSCDRARCGESPVVALVPDASGRGYWLVFANCKVVSFGDAAALSNAACRDAAQAPQARVAGAGRAPDGRGFWVLLSDGRIYAVGDAVSFGSWYLTGGHAGGQSGVGGQSPYAGGQSEHAGGRAAPAPAVLPSAVALVPTSDGGGAWVVEADGSVERLGDAPALGGLPLGAKLDRPVVAAAGA
jgi:hypothetical protein